MKRTLVRLVVVASALTACRPGEPQPTPQPPPPSTVAPSREPSVRVGIAVDTTAVTVSAQTQFDILVGERVLAQSTADDVWTVRINPDGRIDATSAAGATIPPQEYPLRIVARMNGTVLINGRAYRGQALVTSRTGGRITAVNVVELEAYLLGVVPREIGRRPPNEIEAVKAQAVAARTYAVGNLGGREQLGFDFYATIMDQVYGGVADEDSVVTRAVNETRGEIITYDGRPILAYYSSTCGGRTAAIEDSWPWRAPLPYLKSIPDVIPGTDSAYCATSSRFRWTTTWTRDQLLAVLGQTLQTFSSSAGPRVRAVREIEGIATNESGRTTVRLVADDQVYNLRADSVRWVLRPQPGAAILNSSKLYEVKTTDENGQVTGLEITGGGWGHGIGMCQVGAMGRARAGQSYRQILTAYYTGTEIRRLY